MKRPDVIGLGALNVDVIYKMRTALPLGEIEVTAPQTFPGGSAGNSLCALAKLGLNVRIVGKVGRDDNGKLLLSSFNTYGVDSAHVQVDTSEPSGVSHVFVNADGKRTIYTMPGANTDMEKSDVRADILRTGAWVHFSNFVDEKQAWLQRTLAEELDRSNMMSLWVDNNVMRNAPQEFEKIIPYIHTLFIRADTLSQYDSNGLSEGVKKIIEFGCQEVVVLHAPWESEVFTPEGHHHVISRKTSVVDMTGMSCAYVAGFLYSKLRGFPLPHGLWTGNVMMSFCAEKFGCRSNFPSFRQLTERMSLFKEEKNVLVIGRGGREHALAWKLHQSARTRRLYVSPGNSGIAEVAQTVPIVETNIAALKKFVKENNIDLTIVGPEIPLGQGIVDSFEKEGLPIFGPSKKAARIETSKIFAKRFMKRFKIPTAPFQIFTSFQKAQAYIKQATYPLVVKADGLTGGKGVIICHDSIEAEKAISLLMKDDIYSGAGKQIVIEKCLYGQEVSVLAFSDGEHVLPLLPAQDHKAAFDGDEGPNTGGMGAYAPADIVTSEQLKIITDTILQPAIHGMKKIGRPYKGILYAGIILTDRGPHVLEFNCRFGDPEAQAILPLMQTDLLTLMESTLLGTLNNQSVQWKDGYCTCVVLASKGYPNHYDVGKEVTGISDGYSPAAGVFHSGTKTKTVTSGGRVLGVYSTGKTLRQAINRSYDGVKRISFENMHHRNDIGMKGLRKRKH